MVLKGHGASRSSPPTRGQTCTLVMAGCDPLVALLAQAIGARHDVRVLPLLRSSTEALALLKQGLVHVAGVHFTDASGD